MMQNWLCVRRWAGFPRVLKFNFFIFQAVRPRKVVNDWSSYRISGISRHSKISVIATDLIQYFNRKFHHLTITISCLGRQSVDWHLRMMPWPHHAVGGRECEWTLRIYVSVRPSVSTPSNNDVGPYWGDQRTSRPDRWRRREHHEDRPKHCPTHPSPSDALHWRCTDSPRWQHQLKIYSSIKQTRDTEIIQMRGRLSERPKPIYAGHPPTWVRERLSVGWAGTHWSNTKEVGDPTVFGAVTCP